MKGAQVQVVEFHASLYFFERNDAIFMIFPRPAARYPPDEPSPRSILGIAMHAPLADLLPPLVPLPMALAAALRPRRCDILAIAAAALAFALAVAVAVAVSLRGTLAAGPFRADALSAVFLLLTTWVGLVVTRYAATYLAGDPGRGAFLRRLAAALFCVTLVAVAGQLLLLLVAFIGMSLALNTLLLFYAHRPAATLAARKKFLSARLAEMAMLAAAVLLARQHGTLDIAALAAAPRGGAAQEAAVLLVLAACLKCAQLPLHGWLLEVMETPTPVSALLHAGVVNAGGFLLLRLAPLMAASPAASLLLLTIGTLTAAAGAMATPAQTSVKVALAWSTVAQMGFMLMEIGAGFYAAAALHLVAHALYKAHAFLACGGILAERRRAIGLLPIAVGTAAAFLLLHRGASLLFAGVLPEAGLAVPAPVLATGVAALLGVLGLGLYTKRYASGPAWIGLHAACANGFYLNTLVNRAVLRFWPPGPGGAAMQVLP
jgi:NAD(P)H-quinone oxidoreductase subunit 5